MMIFLEDIIYTFIRILIYKFVKLIKLLLEILVAPKVSILCTRGRFDSWKLEIVFI